jgi:hypothetical protein
MTVLYILELEDNKFYVGKTKNIIKNPINYFTKNSNPWTQEYKPIKLINTINKPDKSDEEKQIYLLMNQYGINNVRGGYYDSIELSYSDTLTAQKEIYKLTNKCYMCGKFGHYAKKCNINDATEMLNNINNLPKKERIIQYEDLYKNICKSLSVLVEPTILQVLYEIEKKTNFTKFNFLWIDEFVIINEISLAKLYRLWCEKWVEVCVDNIELLESIDQYKNSCFYPIFEIYHTPRLKYADINQVVSHYRILADNKSVNKHDDDEES